MKNDDDNHQDPPDLGHNYNGENKGTAVRNHITNTSDLPTTMSEPMKPFFSGIHGINFI